MTYSNYKDERDIIVEALERFETLDHVSESMLNWFSTDEIVEWFVKSCCCDDYDDVMNVLDNEDDYNQIIDYYERHCM